MQVCGSVGLITGGASGLGEAVARMLVGAGGRVALLDVAESAGADVAAELGSATRFVPADITDREQVELALAQAVAAFGRLDVTVNCAGVNPGQRVLRRDGRPVPLERFERAVAVNLVGLFDVTRWSAYYMSRNGPRENGERGLIVNVASIAGIEGQAGQSAYAASKGGVLALTLPLARELAPLGIRVLAIAPGMMDTPMLAGLPEGYRRELIDLHLFPKRAGKTGEFAQLVRAFMEITFLNGEVVRLDAGARLPGQSGSE